MLHNFFHAISAVAGLTVDFVLVEHLHDQSGGVAVDTEGTLADLAVLLQRLAVFVVALHIDAVAAVQLTALRVPTLNRIVDDLCRG